MMLISGQKWKYSLKAVGCWLGVQEAFLQNVTGLYKTFTRHVMSHAPIKASP